MADLPHKNKDYFQYIQKLFQSIPNNIKDLNQIFFDNKCPFFDLISKEEISKEFLKYYNNLKNLVFELEALFPEKELSLLKTCQKKVKKVLTRKQVALLFLLSFFNLIKINEKNNCNYFVVSNVLYYSKVSFLFEFGKCFLNYLTQIGKWLSEGNKILDEEIIYVRDNIENLDYNDKELCELNLNEKDSLFEGDASYCVDFANKYIGGGVLRGGSVQEEILFTIEPEAMVSMLFMEVMDKNDAIGIYNTIQYSKYKGYKNKFEFQGNAITNDTQIKKHKIIAIDAFPMKKLSNPNDNYNQVIIMRDIHKAYVGFNLINYENKNEPKTIATGNWGCGAFGGNHELKFIQQWIAASFAGVKRLDYYTFGNKKMLGAVEHYKEIKDKFKNANNLYQSLVFNQLDDNKIIESLLNLPNNNQ